jgi:hypothetical protein
MGSENLLNTVQDTLKFEKIEICIIVIILATVWVLSPTKISPTIHFTESHFTDKKFHRRKINLSRLQNFLALIILGAFNSFFILINFWMKIYQTHSSASKHKQKLRLAADTPQS